MKYHIRKSLLDFEPKSYLHDDDMDTKNQDFIDCSLGINPFGMSESITKELFYSTFSTINQYPSYPYIDLKEAICKYLKGLGDFENKQIIVHTGSMAMLIHLNRVFVEENTKVVSVSPSFTSAIFEMKLMGAKVEYVELEEENNFLIDVDKIIEKVKSENKKAKNIDEKVKIVYIDNPNNPTGQVVKIEDIERLAKFLEKEEVLLIVDEAYGDFMDYENSASSLVNKFENVICVKTFSKGLGLAGLRCGYGIIPKALISIMDKVPAEMAITEITSIICKEALKDKDYIENSRNKIGENKKEILNLISSFENIKYSNTDLKVPIVLLYTNKDENLYKVFFENGIIAERGEDFDTIGKRHLRLRIPKDIKKLKERLIKIEEKLRG